MTTETDKVEMALSDAFEEGWRAAAEWAQREDLCHDIDSPAYSKERDAAIIREVPKLRAAIIADLTADVEPSLYTYTANGTYTMLSDAEPPDDAYDTGTLVRHYPATTVAALKARVAELEKDAARYRWLRSVPNAFKAQRIVNDTPHGMDATIDAAMNGGNQ